MASGCHEATGASRRRSSWRRRRSSGPSGTAGSFVCVVRGRPRDYAPRIRRARHSSPRWRSRACGHRRLLDREPGRPLLEVHLEPARPWRASSARSEPVG